MMYDLMAVSGLFFWIAVLAIIVVVSLPLRDDNVPAGITLLVLGLVGLVLLTDVAKYLSVFWIALFVPLYVVVGVGWALFKWRGYVLAKKAETKTILANRQPSQWPGMSDQEVMKKHRPLAADNKGRITGWMLLWPWSMSWVVFRFPYRFFAWLYERISTVFESWSAKLWAE